MSASLSQPWLNNPVPYSGVLRPRLRVTLRGFDDPPNRRPQGVYSPPPQTEVVLEGAWNAKVERNNWYHGDRFSIQAPLYGGPAYGIGWWSNQGFGLLATIQMQLRDGAWQTVTMGHIDQVRVHPGTGTVMLEGRDLTARFIETKTQESFQNKTASEIVEILAARHGIRAVVQRTTTPVRSYYIRDHVHFSLDQFSRAITEWDLMVSLAQYEGFDLYVEGDAVYFRPPADQLADPPKPYVVQWRNPLIDGSTTYGRESNVTDLELSRALTLARDIEVQVKSWNSRGARGFVRTARAIGARSASPARSAVQYGTATQRFVFVVPNMTEAAAQAYANNQLRLLSQNERLINFKMMGDLRVNPRTLIQLQGTSSDWDQWYYIDHITMNMDFEGGFNMHVSAKNRDARSQVVL